MVHWQLGIGPTVSICGLSGANNNVYDGPHRCLISCDSCDQNKRTVDCPACIKMGNEILHRLARTVDVRGLVDNLIGAVYEAAPGEGEVSLPGETENDNARIARAHSRLLCAVLGEET